jgi:hypothetical protein
MEDREVLGTRPECYRTVELLLRGLHTIRILQQFPRAGLHLKTEPLAAMTRGLTDSTLLCQQRHRKFIPLS